MRDSGNPGLRLALVALLLAGAPAAAAAVEEMDAPRLQPGDRFEHVEQSTFINLTVEARERVTLPTGTYDALRLYRTTNHTFRNPDDPDDETIVGQPINSTARIWIRESDQAFLRSEEMDQCFPVGYQTSCEPHPRNNATQLVDTPCVEWVWPLRVGASWSATCSFTYVRGGSEHAYDTSSRYRVDRAEGITVPAGSFDAHVVELVDETGIVTGRAWFAAGACSPVRQETIYHNFSVDRELIAFSCASLTPPRPVPGSAALLVAALAAAALLTPRLRTARPRATRSRAPCPGPN